MKNQHRIELNGRVLFVSFRSSFQGVSDYLCLHRGEGDSRVRVKWLDTDAHLFEIENEFDSDKAARFERDNRYPWADAVAAVRKAIADQFDDDTREIVRRDMLEFTTPAVRARAQELGLICPASLQS